MLINAFADRLKRTFQSVSIRTVILSIVILLAIVIRFILAANTAHPGHGDHAFYLTLAQNIAEGRGLVIDYIWHFLSNPETITHSACDYWMPLTSVIISVSLLVFGNTFLASLIPSILSGLMLSVLAYLVAKLWSDSKFVHLSSAIVVLFIPSLFRYSLLTDSTIYFAVFAGFSLYCMIRSRTSPKFLLLAAVLAGFSYLTRNDGVLLMIVSLFVILYSQMLWKSKIIYLLSSFVIYIVVVLPVLINNFTTTGMPFQSGLFKTVFLTSYEDLYTYSKEISFRTYLDWGINNILWFKMKAAVINVYRLFKLPGIFLGILLPVGLFHSIFICAKQKEWNLYLPPLLFAGLTFLFYTLIATYPGLQGAFIRSIIAVIPFLVVFSLVTMARLITSKHVLNIVVVLLIAYLCFESFSSANNMIATHNRYGNQLAQIKNVLRDNHNSDDEIIVMTRDPWDVHYSTGFKAVQIPNDDIETIFDVITRYGVNYILLPAPREYLEGIYSGAQKDKRFDYVADISDTELKLFRISIYQD